MKLDIWKVSTLVLGSALALVVSTGAVRETAACDIEDAPPVNRSVQFLKAAASTIDRADMQLKAVETDRGGHRAKALGHLALAMAEIQKGIEVAGAVPRPKPMKPVAGATKAKVVLDNRD